MPAPLALLAGQAAAPLLSGGGLVGTILRVLLGVEAYGGLKEVTGVAGAIDPERKERKALLKLQGKQRTAERQARGMLAAREEAQQHAEGASALRTQGPQALSLLMSLIAGPTNFAPGVEDTLGGDEPGIAAGLQGMPDDDNEVLLSSLASLTRPEGQARTGMSRLLQGAA